MNQIVQEPESFDMSDWEIGAFDSCDTTRCIGGWAIHFAREAGDLEEFGMYRDIAERVLEITHEESEYLFYGHWDDAEYEVTALSTVRYLKKIIDDPSILTKEARTYAEL